MKNFNDEKQKLLRALDNEISQPQKNNTLLLNIKERVLSLQNHTDFDKSLRQTILGLASLPVALRETLFDFDRYFKDKTNWIQSPALRQLAKYLIANNIPMTFYGITWSKQTADWMYFDTVLDVDVLRKQFNMGNHIKVDENLDPRSGTERGFVDDMTGEGIMGRLD